jgi:hypothetical protein
MRSSNSPRYFVPATRLARSSATTRRFRSGVGMSLSAMRCARPSAMAVLPTPASPIRHGLFFVRRQRIWTTRSSSWLATDHRIELRPRGPAGQIAAEVVERRRVAVIIGALLVAAGEVQDGAAHPGGLHVVPSQCAVRRTAALAGQAKEDVLGSDMMIVQLTGLPVRKLQNALGLGSERDFVGRLVFGSHVDVAPQVGTKLPEIHVHRSQDLSSHPLAQPDQTKQQVLGPDQVHTHLRCLIVGDEDGSAGAMCEALPQFHAAFGSLSQECAVYDRWLRDLLFEPARRPAGRFAVGTRKEGRCRTPGGTRWRSLGANAKTVTGVCRCAAESLTRRPDRSSRTPPPGKGRERSAS